MSSFRVHLTALISATLLTAPAFATHHHNAASSGRSGTSHASTGHSKSSRASSAKTSSRSSSSRRTRRTGTTILTPKKNRSRGQQSISSERVAQIQQALIRENYLNGEPSGNWDSTTIAAMQRYQVDQGFITRHAPDARAIKKLGLGPDYSNAINAKDGHFVDPPSTRTIPTDQTASFTQAAGVN